ncbi:hypothetical protein O5853_29830, partial [Escherichia coli]|nr:hypothetical protein [Escherichia coli]
LRKGRVKECEEMMIKLFGEPVAEFFINGQYRNAIRMCIFQHQPRYAAGTGRNGLATSGSASTGRQPKADMAYPTLVNNVLPVPLVGFFGA